MTKADEEAQRLEAERMTVYRKKRDRDERGRRYCIMCREGKTKMLERFEG